MKIKITEDALEYLEKKGKKHIIISLYEQLC